MFFDLNIIQCPVCQAHDFDQVRDRLSCKKCASVFPIQNGIPVLVPDPSVVTQLEAIDYDKHHWIDPSRKQRIFNDWNHIFTQCGIEFGHVMEIGSGTGQVTHVLAERFPFTCVHASDISSMFLESIRSAADAKTAHKLKYYAADANHLPFRDNTFNLVVGNSVLHHFVDYDKCLAKVYQLLVPGGYGVFHEPVIQGKIWIAFFADMMLRIDGTQKLGIFTKEEREKLARVVRHIVKDKWVGADRQQLMEMEDKYIFDISKMEKLAKDIGFSGLEFINNDEPDVGYRKHVIDHLLMAGIPGAKIEKFRFMNVAFEATFSALLQHQIKTPMGYFVFKK